MSAAPSLSPKTRECPYCRRRISAAALKCRYCGESVSVELRVEYAAARRWSPRIAAVLSLLIPGAGQIYKGQFVRGLWFMLVISVGYVLTVLGLFVLPPFALLSTVLLCHLAVVVDAATTAVRVPVETEHWWTPLSWKQRVVVALVLLFFAAVFAYDVVMIVGS